MKQVIDRLDFIKIANFRSAKCSAERIKRQALAREVILAKHISENTVESKMNKELLNLTLRKEATQLKIVKFLNRYLTKGDVHLANKHMKDVQHHVVMGI